MRRHARLSAGILLALAFHLPAYAWGGPGHAAVAALAYRQLPPEARQRFTEILRSHPNFSFWQQDFDQAKAGFPADLDLGAYLFIRASTWPDEIRHSTIPSPFNHPNWHFVDYPLQQSDFSTGPAPTPEDDILFGIKESRRVLQDASAPPAAKAAHLSWLIHLVGDLHQPLHCATLLNKSSLKPPDGDRGGNKLFISVPGKKTAVNLHSLWDGQLGSALKPDPLTAFNTAVALEAEHPRASFPQLATAADAEAWSLESRDAAAGRVYRYPKTSHGQTQLTRLRVSTNDHKAPPLPGGYSDQAQALSRERISLAGYRLADALQAVNP